MTTAAVQSNPLLDAPVLPTLLRLATPNFLGMGAATVVSIAETAYIGVLGTVPLAAAALVFPAIMLMQMMSAGAMGGGVSSAVSRALGAGDRARAAEIAQHAAVLGFGLGVFFTICVLLFGDQIFAALGAEGPAHDAAVGYARIVFLGVIGIWLQNMLASILRGGGDMVAPSVTLLAGALVQVGVGGALCFGLGPLPRLELTGVALGQIAASTTTTLVFFLLLKSPRARVPLLLAAQLSLERFRNILQVGLPACMSPIQTVATMFIITAVAAQYGTETLAGYGIGARLEFLLIPIAFSIGVASLPMVGLAIGAGDVARARRVAWTAGALAGVGMGVIGLVFLIAPDLWARNFSSDPAVLDAARAYLRFAGPGFALFGIGLALYFSSQGAGRVLGPILGGTTRLAIVAIGGWLLVTMDAPRWAMFALVAVGMAALGIVTALFVAFTPWQSTPAQKPR